ncbi:MAG: DUF2298 domain-containing protein, partial [Anaerolineae bacterium]|nr:DUF2298 domain-containing protein [Anaerolineae bacterium]
MSSTGRLWAAGDGWLTPRLFRVAVLAVVAVATVVRFQGLDWDQGTHLHPDERYLTMVVSTVRFPGERVAPGAADGTMGAPSCSSLRSCLASYWDTDDSPLNPANYDAFATYVYGTIPLFMTRGAARSMDAACAVFESSRPDTLPGRIASLWPGLAGACTSQQFLSYDGIHLVGRALSGAMDIVTLVTLAFLGRRLYGRLTGLLAGALYAFAVLPVQHAHFFVVDSFATVFVVWSLLFCVMAVQRANQWWLVLAGSTTGMAIASKVSVWPLAGIVALAALLLVLRKPTHDLDEPLAVPGPRLVTSSAALLLAGAAALVAFRSLQPYAFSGPGFFDVGLNPRWLAAVREVQELMSGLRDVPFGHQWTARLPVVFPWRNMVLWGLGLPLGIAATAGWVWMGWDLAVGTAVGTAVRRRKADLLLWTWSTVFFFYQATQWVKSMRYLLPVYPFLALFAAWATIRIASRAVCRMTDAQRCVRSPLFRRGEQTRRGLARGLAASVPVIVLTGTALWCLSFTAIYRQPVTRVEASRWIFDNVPTAAVLETSDDRAIHVPLAPGTALSATHDEAITLSVNPTQDAAVRAVVLPKVDGLGMTERRTLSVALIDQNRTASAELAFATAHVSLPETGTTRVRLVFDDPVFVSAGTSVEVRVELTAGPDVVLETSVIANEHWDDPLPLRVDGKDPFWDWYQGLDSSVSGQLNLYDFDTVEKRVSLLAWLDEADIIVLSSNRLYASIPRLPARYPLTTAYYSALFDGTLGFELVAEFVSYPSLGRCQFPDQENPFAPGTAAYSNARPCSIALAPAEEAFSVYDHPTVYIFEKTPAYARLQTEAALPRSLTDGAAFVTPRQASAGSPGDQNPDALVASPRLRAEQEAGGTWARLFNRDALQNRFPRISVAVWGLAVTLLGWIAFPLMALWLPDLRLGGYGLARTAGLLVWSFCSWLLASLRLVPHTRGTLWLLLLVLGLGSACVAYRHRARLAALVAANWRDFLIIDGLFVGLYLAWVGVRWLNPDLWHPYMGGEKPMDFAYLNAVVKSTWFPPYDPWFAGGTLNYYYFGFVMVGSLVEALGVVPSVAYNLAVPTLFSLTGVGAYALASSLAGGNARDRDGRSRRAGLCAVLLVLVLGNLGEAQLLFSGLREVGAITFESRIPGYPEAISSAVGIWKVLFQGARLPFRPEWPYWNPTRIIPIAPDELVVPITEFPAFTFLYADLHAHMMALPLTQVALGLALQWSLGFAAISRPSEAGRTAPSAGCGRRPRRMRVAGWLPVSVGSIVLAGLVGAALRMTNTWDYPTYVGLMAGGILLGATGGTRRSGSAPRHQDPEPCREELDIGYRHPLAGEKQHRTLAAPRARLPRTSHVQLLRAIAAIVLFAGATELLARPYLASYQGAYDAVEPWQGSRTPLVTYLLMYGQFLFPIALSGAVALVRIRRDEANTGARSTGADRGNAVLRSAALVLAALVASVLLIGYLGISIAWLAIPLGATAAALVAGCQIRFVDMRQRVIWFWVGTALTISLLVEVVVLKGDLERMNTVFKFHLQVWMLLALSAAGFVEGILRGKLPSHDPPADGTQLAPADTTADADVLTVPLSPVARRSRWIGARGVVALAMGLLLFGAALYPAFAIPARIRDRWGPSKPMTLDGMAYM